MVEITLLRFGDMVELEAKHHIVNTLPRLD
jgi:hypothetical protein